MKKPSLTSRARCRNLRFSASAITFAAGLSSMQAATTLQIVADNDFAVLTGTDSTVTRIIYQNGVVWNSQLSAASDFTFDLEAGETTFYVLAMGGGGQENISGTINGVNIATLDNVSMSPVITPGLSGYNFGTVANGSYTPSLADVQAAYPALPWDPVNLSGTSVPVVIASNPNAFDETLGRRVGFIVPSNNAVLFRFAAEEIGLETSIPEPSSYLGLSALLLAGLMSRARRS